MAERSGVDAVRSAFAERVEQHLELARAFVDDPEVVVKDAEERFDAMVPTMAYVDSPNHPMAGALFECSALLALQLALAERGVDVHEFGSAMLDGMATAMSTSEPEERTPEMLRAFIEAAAASQRDPQPGQFVFELLRGDESSDWGMNITSCAICHQFSKHDAMDLVPYMCACDDVVSDARGQGLRRTGTIALGAHQCDFRYQQGGTPVRVAEQYPERIRIRGADA